MRTFLRRNRDMPDPRKPYASRLPGIEKASKISKILKIS